MERETDRKAVLIFVHGFGSSAECWTPLISLLKRMNKLPTNTTGNVVLVKEKRTQS